MEISTLTRFITPFLPYLLKLGKGAADTATNTAASKFGEAAWQKSQAIWTALSPKVEAKETTKEAVTDVANNPEDEDYQAVLRVQLKKLLASDEALANQLTKLFQSDNPNSRPTTQITQTVTGNQNQTVGQISGGQVFGNVTGSVIISGSGNSVSTTSTDSTDNKEPSVPVTTILVLASNPKRNRSLTIRRRSARNSSWVREIEISRSLPNRTTLGRYPKRHPPRPIGL